MAETIDYAAVLADLKAKRAALDTAIAGIEASQGLSGEVSQTSLVGEQTPALKPVEKEISDHSFFSLTIPEAIKKCFAIVKRPMAVSEITTALQQGGLITNASNLPATVSGTLGRMKRSGELVALGKGKWGPSDWFKGSKKTLADAQSPKRKRKARKAKAKKESSGGNKSPIEFTWNPTPEQVARIKTMDAEGKGFGEISKATGVHALAVSRVIGVKKKKQETPSPNEQAVQA